MTLGSGASKVGAGGPSRGELRIGTLGSYGAPLLFTFLSFFLSELLLLSSSDFSLAFELAFFAAGLSLAGSAAAFGLTGMTIQQRVDQISGSMCSWLTDIRMSRDGWSAFFFAMADVELDLQITNAAQIVTTTDTKKIEFNLV